MGLFKNGASASALVPACVLGSVLMLTGCLGQSAASAPSTSPTTSALGQDVRLYVDPQGNAVQAVADLRRTGRSAQADRLQHRVADKPSAVWLTNVSEAVYGEARSVAVAAAAKDALPVLGAYNLPQRDCGGYSRGGAADIDAYLDWVGSLAAGIGQLPAAVVLEPDAVAHTLDGCVPHQLVDERYRALTEAVRILKRQPGVRVYLDAGNASWVSDLERLSSALRASGVAESDGFALNVSNFVSTERSVRYGDRLSELLGGARYVIDTSRNGAGATTRGAEPGSSATWCNPPSARLGAAPTTTTGHARVDAYLWVKQPGDSDGACGDGAPPAGKWWPPYAARLMSEPTP